VLFSLLFLLIIFINGNKLRIAQSSCYEHAVFLDIVKSFDCVDNFILIAKLKNSSLRGPFYELLSSSLKERTQYVSSVSNVKFVVPQGSVLGPLLFLVFINYLCRAFNMIMTGISFK